MLLIDIFKKLFNKDTTRFPLRKLLIDEITRLNRKYNVKGFARLNLTCYDNTSWNNVLRDAVNCPVEIFYGIPIKATVQSQYLTELNRWHRQNIHPIFIRWIKNELCYHSYKHGVDFELSKPEPLYKNVLMRPPSEYICSAFKWNDSPNSIDWYLVHIKWWYFLQEALNV